MGGKKITRDTSTSTTSATHPNKTPPKPSKKKQRLLKLYILASENHGNEELGRDTRLPFLPRPNTL
jgi:hypothetical protein